MNAAEFISRLGAKGKPRKTLSGWQCCCPAHEDKSPSLSVTDATDGKVLLRCFSGCTPEAICAAVGLTMRDLFPSRPTLASAPPARPPAKPVAAARETFDWRPCVAAFTDVKVQKLATWRGLSIEFVRWLHAQGAVGIFEGKIAFANHGDGGAVVSAHYRRGDGTWRYKPAGHPTAPLKSFASSSRADVAREYLGGDSGPAADELPDLKDAAEFLAAPIEPPDELVAGILHKGSKLAFGGSSKSFKTWSLLDLAISVSAGVNWLGRETAQGKVLFVNFEIQPHPWQKRIAVVAQAKGVKVKAGQIILWNLRGHAADFKKLIPRIIARASRENFALIVIDPIYKLYAGNTDENSAGDVAALLNSLENLATKSGAAIAFGAHFAKGNAAGKDALDRISGSGVFARDPDSLLIFTKHEEDEAFTVEAILRNFAPVPPFVVRWEYLLMQRVDDLDPAKLKTSGGRPTKHRPQDLLDLLPADGLGNADWLAAADAKGMSRSSFYGLRRKLKDAGKVLESVVSGKWQPTLPKTTP